MELYAINIARLKNTQAFKDTSIRVSYTTSMLTIDVRHDSSFDPKTSSELFKLKAQISGLKESLKLMLEKLNMEMKELEHVERKELHSSGFLPSSCLELSTMGHYLNGLYLVANKSTRKIQTVNCQFGPTGTAVTEAIVGNLDVKTKSVHFCVKRMTTFTTSNTVIPFELELLNLGGAMDTSSGIFTAPVEGIYHFEFMAMKDGCTSCILGIEFHVNGKYVGYARTSTNGDHETTSFTASLRLKHNDTVNLFKQNGANAALYGAYTFFSGWLVEEDL